jgi:hypothetical protein
MYQHFEQTNNIPDFRFVHVSQLMGNCKLSTFKVWDWILCGSQAHGCMKGIFPLPGHMQ